MLLNTLVRVLKVLGFIGALGVVGTTVWSIVSPDSISVTAGVISTVACLFVLFGFIGSYLIQFEALGRFGLLGFLALLTGLSWVISLNWVFAFVTPALQVADPNILNNIPPYPLNIGFLTTDILMAVGWILYGLSLLLRSKISRWPGLVLIITGLSVFIPTIGDNMVAPIITSIAVAWLCMQTNKTESV